MRVHRAVGIALVVPAALILAACAPDKIASLTSVSSVSVQPDTLDIDVDAHAPLSASGVNALGTPMLGLAPTWSSADPGIAQVSQTGDVLGMAAGETTITATVNGHVGHSIVRVRQRVATVIVAPAA